MTEGSDIVVRGESSTDCMHDMLDTDLYVKLIIFCSLLNRHFMLGKEVIMNMLGLAPCLARQTNKIICCSTETEIIHILLSKSAYLA